MTSLTWMLVAPAVLGVDFGWQPVAGGGIQYIIRLDEEQLDSLKDGEDILSDLPPNMDVVHTYRITTVSGDLPNQGIPPRKRATTLAESAGVTSTAHPTANLLPGTVPMTPIPQAGSTSVGPAFPHHPATGNGFVNTNSGHVPPSTTPIPSLPSTETPRIDGSHGNSFASPQTTFTNRPQDPAGMHTPVTTSIAETKIAERPHSAWVATIVALGLSLGANCYLGMLSVSLYNRCRVLLGQLRFASLRG